MAIPCGKREAVPGTVALPQLEEQAQPIVPTHDAVSIDGTIAFIIHAWMEEG